MVTEYLKPEEDERAILFVVNAIRWFDKVNGNTYHSVKITRVSDNAEIKTKGIVYGYGDHYRQTARELMLKAGWMPEKYNDENDYLYERENNYPIYWDIKDGLKRDAINNIK